MKLVTDVIAQNPFPMFGGKNQVDENLGQRLRHVSPLYFALSGLLIVVRTLFPGRCPGLD
jgi:hypothetical protein